MCRVCLDITGTKRKLLKRGDSMRYVEKNLRKNEHVIATAQVTLWAIAAILLRTLLLAGILYAVLYFGTGAAARYMPDDLSTYVPTGSNGMEITLYGLILLTVLAAAFQIIRLLCIQMVVTDKKLIGKCGVIYVRALDVYLEKIDNFTIEETILGRIFGYNTITVGTASSTMKFRYIARAIRFKNAVMDCYDARIRTLMNDQAQLIQTAYAAYEEAKSEAAMEDFSDLDEDAYKNPADQAKAETLDKGTAFAGPVKTEQQLPPVEELLQKEAGKDEASETPEAGTPSEEPEDVLDFKDVTDDFGLDETRR